MPPLSRWFLLLGGVNALAAVLLGAFGAHALRQRMPPELQAIYQTGNQYHFYHALGLLAVGLLLLHLPASPLLKWSGWLMLAGIIIFSGSLYAFGVSGARWLGAVTPFGGTAFIIAWLLLAVAIWRA